MLASGILLFLCLNVYYVTSFDPITLWNDPIVWKYYGTQSSDFLPKNKESAVTKGWNFVQMDHHGRDLKAYCDNFEPNFCTLHDKHGLTVGIVILVLKDDKVKSPYSLDTSSWFKIRKIFGKDYYTLDIYLAKDDHIKDPKKIDPVSVQSIGETFRIINKNGDSTEVKYQESNLVQDGWEKQNCEAQKGTHYLHKITDSDCKDFWPIAMLVKKTQVVGFSLIIPGEYQGKFFDKVDHSKFKERYPKAPDCLKKWAKDNKITTFYVTLASTSNMYTCDTKDHIKPLTLGAVKSNFGF